ncbi:MAG: molybdate ABC transporter substrate-binding protein [Synergistaceae bacterium]|nr:molybdate ABC transporter substrate-binding protein [Synergistaceae bacterium]
MRKFTVLFALLLSVVMVQTAFAETLTVFAAASMQAAMEKIGNLYTESNPSVEITYNFDSSGTLKTQIEEGAECDLFISAAQKQMNALEKLNLIDKSTRINLLENKVVLVVPEGNPANITSFTDISSGRLHLIALGNSDVPVGAYSQEILENMGIWDKLNSEGKISFTSNVTETAMQVREGAADCGIIYATDAATHKLNVVAEPPAGTLKTPVIYPAAVLSGSKHSERASDFLNFLKGSEAREIFASIGFTPAK